MAFLGFRAGPPSYDWRDVAAQKRIALVPGIRDGMGWEAAQLLAEIDTADDFYFDTCTQVNLQRWTAGRVALLGDAGCCASPLSGHGTTLAVVGAYVLAGELAGNYAVAFARYEHQLRPWVEEIHGSARRWGGLMIPENDAGRSTPKRLRAPAYIPTREITVGAQHDQDVECFCTTGLLDACEISYWLTSLSIRRCHRGLVANPCSPSWPGGPGFAAQFRRPQRRTGRSRQWSTPKNRAVTAMSQRQWAH
jgi:hypothetical protein